MDVGGKGKVRTNMLNYLELEIKHKELMKKGDGDDDTFIR